MENVLSYRCNAKNFSLAACEIRIISSQRVALSLYAQIAFKRRDHKLRYQDHQFQQHFFANSGALLSLTSAQNDNNAAMKVAISNIQVKHLHCIL